jgi:transposase-like protein
MNDFPPGSPTLDAGACGLGGPTDEGSVPDLNEAQQRAAGLIALGHRDVDVARQLGCHPQTVRRWKKDPAVGTAIASAGARLDAELNERMSVFNSRLVEGKLKAIDALMAQLDAADPAVVVKSAEALLKA